MPRRFAALCLTIIFLARGQARSDSTIDPALAPFLTGTTLAVVRWIPSRLDLNAIEKVQEQMLHDGLTRKTSEAILPQYQQGMDIVRQWTADFSRVGGKTVYVICYLRLPNNMIGLGSFLFVVPLDKGASSRDIASLFVNGEPGGPDHRTYPSGRRVEAIVLHNAIAFSTFRMVESMKTQQAVARPDVAAALSAGGDRPLVAAFSPTLPFSILVSRSIKSFPPNLPSGYPMASLMSGLAWVSASSDPPPVGHLSLRIQCRSDAAAQMWSDAIDAALEMYRRMPQNMETLADPSAAVDAMRPDLRENQLVWNLNQRQVAQINQGWMPMILGEDRPVAPTLVPAANVVQREKQILMGILVYRSSHGGRLPDKLDEIAPDVGGPANLRQLLTSPSHPRPYPGFIYLKPSALDRAPQRMILYEAAPDGNAPVAVGYLDGHIDQIPRSVLQYLLSLPR